MGAPSGSASLPPPCPKSPPVYPDLYGKRRELAKVQMLEREIGFLEVSRILQKSSDVSGFWFYDRKVEAVKSGRKENR